MPCPPIPPSGVELARALESAGAASRLTAINLSQNGIGDDAAEAFGRALAAQGPRGALRTLGLDENQIGDRGAAGLAQGLRVSLSLKWLDLSRNLSVGPDGAAALAWAISGTGSAASQLTYLQLNCCDIGDDGVAAMLDAGLGRNASVTHLDVGFNYIGEEGCMALALWAESRFFPPGRGEQSVGAAAALDDDPASSPRSGGAPPAEDTSSARRAKPLKVILNVMVVGGQNLVSAEAAASLREVEERANAAAEAAGWRREVQGPALALCL